MNDILIEVEGGKSVRCKTANKVCKGDIVVTAKGGGDDLYRQMIDGSISGEVIIPDGVTSIRDYAFYGCKNITNVVLPNTIAGIGSYAFSNSSISGEFSFPRTEKKINTGLRLFQNTLITKITIPTNLNTMNGNIFCDMPYLETVIVEHGVTMLVSYALAVNKKLKTLSLPNTVTSWHGNVLSGCSALEFVTLEQGFKANGLDLSYSTLYSVETLIAMFEAYADMTGQTALKLIIGPTNIAKLTEEQIAILTEKNVTLA